MREIVISAAMAERLLRYRLGGKNLDVRKHEDGRCVFVLDDVTYQRIIRARTLPTDTFEETLGRLLDVAENR